MQATLIFLVYWQIFYLYIVQWRFNFILCSFSSKFSEAHSRNLTKRKPVELLTKLSEAHSRNLTKLFSEAHSRNLTKRKTVELLTKYYLNINISKSFKFLKQIPFRWIFSFVQLLPNMISEFRETVSNIYVVSMSMGATDRQVGNLES